MSIKGAKALSIGDLKGIFEKLPRNYVLSFIRQLHKRQLNLPSSALRPKLDPSGFFYTDINYVEATQVNSAQSVIEKNRVANNLCFEIRLVKATGVPIPAETFQRDNFYKREIGVALFDRRKNSFIGNAITFPCEWSNDSEDEWLFPNGSLFLRWGTFSELDTNVDLVFEFICHIDVKKKPLALSASFAEVKLSTLKRETLSLDLRGGGP
jgi:hypothetical protein